LVSFKPAEQVRGLRAAPPPLNAARLVKSVAHWSGYTSDPLHERFDVLPLECLISLLLAGILIGVEPSHQRSTLASWKINLTLVVAGTIITILRAGYPRF
jgi:hypothetical protein